MDLIPYILGALAIFAIGFACGYGVATRHRNLRDHWPDIS